MSRTMMARRAGVLAVAGTLILGAAATPAFAGQKVDKATKLAEKLVEKVTADGANRHLRALQRIADQNGGNRAVNTPGYDASVEYVAGKLRAAGFLVTTPDFTYEEEVIDAATVTVGDLQVAIDQMDGSPNTPEGGVTGPLVAVGAGDATPGCEPEDYAGIDVVGAVVLVPRGACAFALKASEATAAGAVAVVISNNVDGPLSGTLGDPAPVVSPTGGTTLADGAALAAVVGSAATVDLRLHLETRTSKNVIAQTRTGRADNVVMNGAHLDSVPAGPGINDNGTGSAALLETALKLGAWPKVNNQVRFAWWGAEELGLLGADYYANNLTLDQQVDIAMYLNYDMIGSPNAGYFVYDGDDSDAEGAGAGPVGSAQIEATLAGFLNNRLGVPTEGTDFDGRSDYGPFIALGIPSGGLFTGAEGLKSEEQAALWGGTAGVAYDPCYHAACDNLLNVDRVALDRNLDAVAWTAGVYAYSTENINGVPNRAQRAEMRAASRLAAATSTQVTLDPAA